ncbi:MAG: hypothetical protein K8H88_13850, partial [Sandaracinaceae bacterium]|nr:hypothetical protein [Sandaracinaceae bacterium]
MAATITSGDRVPEPRPRGLLARALVRFALGALVLGALFFGTAGTFDYWEAWVWMGVMFTPMTFLLIQLLRHDRALLERRLQ